MKAEIGKKKEKRIAQGNVHTYVNRKPVCLSVKSLGTDPARKIISHPQVQVHALPTHTHTHEQPHNFFFSCGIKTKSEAKRRSCVKVRTVLFSHFCYFLFYPARKKNSSLTTGKRPELFFLRYSSSKNKGQLPLDLFIMYGIVKEETNQRCQIILVSFGELWTLGSCCFVKNRPDRKKKRKKRRRDQIVTHDQN